MLQDWNTMKQRVATDERPFKTGSTDETPSEEEPAAALVIILPFITRTVQKKEIHLTDFGFGDLT